MDIILIFHLLGVVFWIGGVGFVTTVMFPTIQSMEDSLEKVKVFLGIEKRFARLARVYVILVGITGVMLFLRKGGLEWAFANPILHLMVAFKVILWLIFFILLFGAEKHIIKRLVSAQSQPEKAFKRMQIFHGVLLLLSGITIVFGIML